MKKIGLLILSLVFALGAVGVGYAMWSDTVWIDGGVNTGCVDIEVDSVSGTWVYKVLATGEILYSSEELALDPDEDQIDELLYVARAVAEFYDPEFDPEDEAIYITLDNIFPTYIWDDTEQMDVDYPLIADVMFHYHCTVPAHIYWDKFTWNCDAVFGSYLIWNWTVMDGATLVYEGTDVASIQLHDGYTLYLEVYFNPTTLQNNPDLQNLSCGFSTNFNVHQWNEDWPVVD